MSALRVNGAARRRLGIFGVMIWMLFLRFIVPVLGVFYGTSLMADEVEDKTITYLFTRPIPRGAVLVGKYLAYLVCTTLVVLPSVMLVYFLLVPFSQLPATFGQLVIDLGPAGARPGGLRRRVRVRRGVLQAAAGHRAGLRVRLGAGRAGHAGLPEAVHRRLLPPGAGAARDAVGRGRQPAPGDVPGDPAGLRSAWPGFSRIWAVFCILRPGWSSARNTSSSSRPVHGP